MQTPDQPLEEVPIQCYQMKWKGKENPYKVIFLTKNTLKALQHFREICIPKFQKQTNTSQPQKGRTKKFPPSIPKHILAPNIEGTYLI